jgi:Tetracyclin repressor-like, C-terminal domain
VLTEFAAQRRAALRALLERGQVSGDLCANANLDLLVDVFYGVLWYRLLVGHAPLDPRAARDLAAHLITAGGPDAAGLASARRPGEGG